jgi:hypothetical protein
MQNGLRWGRGISRAHAGLPDGIFSNQKSQFGQILEGLAMENFGVFNAHLEYMMPVGYILRSFSNFVEIW